MTCPLCRLSGNNQVTVGSPQLFITGNYFSPSSQVCVNEKSLHTVN